VNSKNLSILTVTKDNLSELVRTLNSIVEVAVSSAELEVVVVDSSIEKQAANKCKRYVDELANAFDISYIWVPPNGIYQAMNHGLDYLSGDWVLFLNSGDTFHDNLSVNGILNLLEPQKTNCFPVQAELENGSRKIFGKPKLNRCGLFMREPHHQGMFFPRCFYKLNRFSEDYRISSDFDYKIRAMEATDLCFHPLPVTVFYFGGISTAPVLKNLIVQYRERHEILKAHGFFSNLYFFYSKALLKVVLSRLSFIRFLPKRS
jgi:glycosyltransferase involved in cell wall biosynthesis